MKKQIFHGLALTGGSSIALLVMSYPWIIAFSPMGIREFLFMLCTMAAAGGFIYGLGYRPTSAIFRILLSPAVIFPLILLSLGWISYALYLGPSALAGGN